MKLIKADHGEFLFHIGAKEKQVLFTVLGLYPAIPPAHQRLSKAQDRPNDQALLDAALAEQRAQNKKQVMAMMASQSHFQKTENGWRFSVATEQVEWLLQVLNDVRVGSWLALGSPDGPQAILAALNDQNAPHFWAMEMSGHFQGELLAALRGK